MRRALAPRRRCVDLSPLRSSLTPAPDVNKQDNDGFTALHWAATKGNWHVANFLIHAGADRSIKDNENQTAEDIATKKRNGLIANLLANASHWTAKVRFAIRFYISRTHPRL